MRNSSHPSHFLRRRDKRRNVQFGAIAECHGISRAIEVVDFSTTGLRINKVALLAPGDRVTIFFRPGLAVEGTIVWLVWHKAGLQFTQPLKPDDPACQFLMEQAAFIEQAHVRAIGALAQWDPLRARESE
jgi:hypothetical protein